MEIRIDCLHCSHGFSFIFDGSTNLMSKTIDENQSGQFKYQNMDLDSSLTYGNENQLPAMELLAITK